MRFTYSNSPRTWAYEIRIKHRLKIKQLISSKQVLLFDDQFTLTLLAAINRWSRERSIIKMRRIIQGTTEDTNEVVITNRQYRRRVKEEVKSKETPDNSYTQIMFYVLLAAFVTASLTTRLYKLNEPTHIA